MEIAKQYAIKQHLGNNIIKSMHAAIIFKSNGQILSIASNVMYLQPINGEWSMHAEHHAIKKISKKPILNGCKMIVVRVSKKSMGYNLMLSKPCIKCANRTSKWGINTVYYSTDDPGYLLQLIAR